MAHNLLTSIQLYCVIILVKPSIRDSEIFPCHLFVWNGYCVQTLAHWWYLLSLVYSVQHCWWYWDKQLLYCI